MNGLREKFRNKKGFTLIEMLIVVAIIAILVAVSIPLIGNALESARDATDQANERAAKAEALLWYMGVDGKTLTFSGTPEKATMIYDADNGTLVATTGVAVHGYGKCTGCNNTDRYPNAGTSSTAAHTDKVIQVEITKDEGKVTMTWVTAPTG